MRVKVGVLCWALDLPQVAIVGNQVCALRVALWRCQRVCSTGQGILEWVSIVIKVIIMHGLLPLFALSFLGPMLRLSHRSTLLIIVLLVVAGCFAG